LKDLTLLRKFYIFSFANRNASKSQEKVKKNLRKRHILIMGKFGSKRNPLVVGWGCTFICRAEHFCSKLENMNYRLKKLIKNWLGTKIL